MFGHSDNQQTNNPITGGQPATQPVADDQIMQNGSLEQPDTTTGQSTSGFSMNNIPSAPVPQSPFSDTSSQSNPTPVSKPDLSASQSQTTAGGSDLLSLKQKALQELSPLVGQLEQSPEEKFRTTMMMIQASDDQSLLSAAYDAAQAISDEKARAQALLDVVNEINYFTQSK